MRRERRAANRQRLAPPASTVEVFIDEVVLHGFSAADRDFIGEALAREMEQGLAQPSARSFLSQATEVSRINASPIALPPASRAQPAWVGAQIGKSVFGSLMNSQSERVSR